MLGAYELPVSRKQIALRWPSGVEDLLLVEAPLLDVALAVALATRLAPAVDGTALDWWAMPAADLDAWLLALHRQLFGDLLRSSARCSPPGCGERIDIAFGVGDYLRHHRPRRPRALRPSDAGWLRLDDVPGIRFRIPSVTEQHAAATTAAPVRLLRARCVLADEGVDPSGRALRRIERALAVLAPCLADDLTGVCPECGGAVTVTFDPLDYVLRELREQAAWIYQDVHVLAASYGWREVDVLALPAMRRLRYAELALADRSRA